ncbi:MAG TPA: N-formylglutamate deformylase, partial [Pararobbsia sp.]|nr:N-formylglutamate deformylase [Pararobbsia sp.]
PHLGTHLPNEIAATMTDAARRLDDTDWHLDRLYGFAKTLGASMLTPSYSRYVVDLNRPPDGASLYPGRDTTGLFPVDTFGKDALYLAGKAPDETMQGARRKMYWQPYHDALRNELDRLKREHGRVLLWEAHSIRSVVPRLFEGRLPDFNFGTADDQSARPGLGTLLSERVNQHGGYSSIANGRFKGGYITRHYGTPDTGIHAVQLELTQISYMEEVPPYAYDDAKAAAIEPLLAALVTDALAYCTRG